MQAAGSCRSGWCPPATRVLYMSGYAQTVLGTEGALDPHVDLLEKPFAETALLARVRQAIDRKAPDSSPPPAIESSRSG